jgi:hypothetical protein
MTYETGTANDLEDLLAKLSTFAVTTHGGWTEGYLNTTNGWFELHKGSLSASFKYTKSGTPTTLSVHQATGFINTSTAPGAHTADSGNGFNTTTTGHSNANLETERCVRHIGNGPFPSYYFFADDTDNDYIHVCVEVSTGMYRHFGFGILDKTGNNWVGGEYAYGHYQDAATNALPLDPNTQTLLDGLTASSDNLRAATVRIASGLANQGAAVWGVSSTLATGSLGNDTAGNVRRQIHGGYRAGMAARGFGNSIGNFSSGAISLASVSAFYRDPSNPRVYLLGYMPDVRFCNIRNFEPAQEVTIGTDVWKFFPQSIKTTAAVLGRSLNSGIAYRKVP